MINVTELIDEYYTKRKQQKPRAYIGASGIGQQCDASISYSFRGYPDTAPDARLSRIFRDGHRIEDDVVRDMRKAGIHVMEKDPYTGRQWRFEGYGGLVMGNADGIVEMDGETIGLEIKSMNDAKHKEFVRKGIKGSHPSYYDQMQFMMGLSGMTMFLMVAYNKNTSLYHHEYVEFDDFRFAFLTTKVERVIKNEAQKISEDESDWRCRGCFKRGACWGGLEPEEKTVRTCGNSYAEVDGTWKCSVCDAETCADWKLYVPKPRG